MLTADSLIVGGKTARIAAAGALEDAEVSDHPSTGSFAGEVTSLAVEPSAEEVQTLIIEVSPLWHSPSVEIVEVFPLLTKC